MPQRNITLTDELDQWIDARLATGLYSNASEFVREALRRLKRDEDREDYEQYLIASQIQSGINDLAEGRYVTLRGSDELRAHFQKRRTERLAELDADDPEWPMR